MLTALCIFCSAIAAYLFDFTGPSTSLSAIAAVLNAYLIPASIALWIHADARRRPQRSLPYDFAALVFFMWPIAAPIYLFRTRGLRAFGPIAIFVLLMLAATFLAGLLESAALNSL